MAAPLLARNAASSRARSRNASRCSRWRSQGRLNGPRVRDNFIERIFVYQRWTALQEGPCAPSALIGRLVSDYGGYLRLEEPESTPECEEHIGATHDNPVDTEVACEYADARVVIAMRTDLIEKAPDVVDFFEAYELSDDGIFTLLARYADTGEDAVDIASWWLQNFR